jgi:cephalosporin-C deacetylase-like acetyl esterase
VALMGWSQGGGVALIAINAVEASNVIPLRRR